MPARFLLWFLIAAAVFAAPEASEQMTKARQALVARDIEAARRLFEAARNHARQRRDDAAGFEAVQMLALLARGAGDWAKTEDWLAEAFDDAGRIKGYDSIEAIDIMTEIASARRARGNLDGAAAILQQALSAALAKGERERLRAARIATLHGLVRAEREQTEQARDALRMAVKLWDETLREDPELLPAIETLGGLLRDENAYAEAAPLYERSLRIREISFGTKSAELIVGLDNLAYVYFGLKRFAEAEVLYNRLLELWVATGGPEHPMLALTMDKIAQFYAVQERFEDADTMARKAMELRGATLAESLRTRARLAAKLNRPRESEDFARKAREAMEIAGLANKEMKLLPAPKDADRLPVPKPKARKRGQSITR